MACKSPSSPTQEALAFSGGEVVGHQRDQPPQWAAARLLLINTGGRNHQELCGGTTPPCHGHGPKDESTWSFLCLTSQQCPASLGFTPPKGLRTQVSETFHFTPEHRRELPSHPSLYGILLRATKQLRRPLCTQEAREEKAYQKLNLQYTVFLSAASQLYCF